MVPIGKRPLTGSIARITSSTCSVMFTVKGNDKPILFLCLTQDSDLAALLGKTAEAYDNEREDV